MTLVGIHFYRLRDFGKQSWSNRLRGLAIRAVSKYVHCNYQIGPVAYDLSAHGLNVFQNGYSVEPSATVWVQVEESKVRQFIARFASDYERGWRSPVWLWIALAAWPPFSLWLKNCSSYPQEIAGGARTPGLLYRMLSRRSVEGGK